MMRVIATSDLHGSVAHYAALFKLIRSERPQTVILAGDLLQPAADPQTAIPEQRSFLSNVLTPWLQQVHTAVPGCRIYAIPGNWDYRAHDERFRTLHDRGLWQWIDRRAVALTEDLWIAGLGDVPITPVPPKDRDRPDDVGARFPFPDHAVVSEGDRLRPVLRAEIASRTSLDAELDRLARLSPPRATIYVLHTPPAQSALDVVAGGAHVGSQVVRQFIARHRPPLTVHGHIHEAPEISGSATEWFGPTLAINAGQRMDALCAVTFDLDDLTNSLQHHVLYFSHEDNDRSDVYHS